MIRFYKFFGAVALAAAMIAAPTASFAGVFVDIGISVGYPPPPLPVYVQPPCPQPDLIWTPGYWAYADDGGYYWVPGAWVPAPEVGYLWTPGYWGYAGDDYAWHPGYWGPQVGFYGGVNYGYGYFGNGFYGGGWSGRHFRYNTAYWNVNRTVVNNIYVNRTVVNNYNRYGRTSYNGGPHGIDARPSARQLAYNGGVHVPATAFQRSHIANAARNRTYRATVNHGRPPQTLASRGTANRSRIAAAERTQYAGAASSERNVRTNTAVARGGNRQVHAAYRPAVNHAAVHHTTTAYHGAAVHHTAAAYHGAAVHHTTAYHAATVHHTTAYHAASTYHAPAYHAASAYHKPAYHAASAYHAPAYHAATAYHAPVYHAAPAYHAAAHPMAQMNHAPAGGGMHGGGGGMHAGGGGGPHGGGGGGGGHPEGHH